jgi:hypothetical protein
MSAADTYTRRLLRLLAAGRLTLPPGTVACLEVRHDRGCARLTRGGPCDCQPELYLDGRPLAKGEDRP